MKRKRIFDDDYLEKFTNEHKELEGDFCLSSEISVIFIAVIAIGCFIKYFL